MKCIYCAVSTKSSEEDWFPRWLGKYKGVGILRDRLCARCNNELGRTVDQAMARESPEAVNRFVLGIPDRDGNPPTDPFLYKAQESPPTVIKCEDDEIDFEPVYTMEGPQSGLWARHLVLRKDGQRPVSIGLKEDFSAKWLKDAVQKRDLVDARVSDIAWDHTGKDENLTLPDRVVQTIAAAIPRFKVDFITTGVRVHALDARGTLRNRTVQIYIRLSGDYARALAKIAFHYLLMFDKHIDGHEPEFDAVKNFIKKGDGAPGDFATWHSREFVVGPRTRQTPGIRHYLFLESDSQNRIRAFMRFFGRGPLSGPPIRIELGRDPFVRRLRLAHVISVFSPRQDNWDGELLSLPVQDFDGFVVISDRRQSRHPDLPLR